MKSTPTYAGIPEEFAQLEKARVVLIPVPYDGTSTWGKGADKGPEAFLAASENMELYDIETGTEVYRQGIYLAPSISEKDSPEAVVREVHQITKDYIKRNKFVTLFGGEHSISIGSIRAFNECFDNLTVLQIDAHADLRKTYLGSPYNHACAVHEAAQTTNLIQVGIRSMDAIEKTYMDPERVFFAHEMVADEFWMDKVIDLMTDHVFITFDLDALDPSIMPATGTPEPGGLFWYETLEFLRKVFQEKNVVGFDLVELCPNPQNRASDFVAAKLYYKMLSYKFMETAQEGDFDEPFDEEGGWKSNLSSKFDDDEL
ncbi:agmatinase [Robiginitalea marina]|uniref:Agmatinase n=1 Tax=Robiginitalea marina TaxID=2954105 RepID=A0ABT1AYL3_9FLAO|nr:agmatinase [Robiginitalea marina]MCO5725125.1 agmatinase [Robiginitalea marina]